MVLAKVRRRGYHAADKQCGAPAPTGTRTIVDVPGDRRHSAPSGLKIGRSLLAASGRTILTSLFEPCHHPRRARGKPWASPRSRPQRARALGGTRLSLSVLASLHPHERSLPMTSDLQRPERRHMIAGRRPALLSCTSHRLESRVRSRPPGRCRPRCGSSTTFARRSRRAIRRQCERSSPTTSFTAWTRGRRRLTASTR